MDKKLQLIRHLYEESDGDTRLNQLLEDPELKQEYQALSEAKFWLDHSKREKPSQDALQAVLALATSEQPELQESSSPPRKREDRAALPRKRSARHRLFGITSVVVATLIIAVVGYQWFLGTDSLLGPAVSPQAMQESSVASEAELADDVAAQKKSLDAAELQEEAGLALDAQRSNQFSPQSALQEGLAPVGFEAASVAQADSAMPDWDKSEEIMLFRQRVDMLLEQNQDIAWDETAVPLESLRTTQPANRRLLQAGSPANNN